LQPVFEELCALETAHFCNTDDINERVDALYDNVVNALRSAADLFIPKCKKSFYKFWWNAELDVLKENAAMSCRIWKNAGKPRHGPIHNKYRQDKLLYKKRIKEEQARETMSFSNYLHDALLRKSGQDFWKMWNSTFDRKVINPLNVNGITDDKIIADNFATHFEKVCTPSRVYDDVLKEYNERRLKYCMMNHGSIKVFSVEQISKILVNLKNGKAAGLDELSCEHLKYSHPIIMSVCCVNCLTYFLPMVMCLIVLAKVIHSAYSKK